MAARGVNRRRGSERGRERRTDRLHRVQTRILDPVEQPLPGAEQHRRDLERELVEYALGYRLTNGCDAARDRHLVAAGHLTRPLVRRIESSVTK